MFKRTYFLGLLLATAATFSFSQDSRPVRIIVPFPPGGATDALARTLAIKLGNDLGQNIVVENKAGASGQIGTAFVKSAPPDGATFLFTTDHTIVTIPHLVSTAGYEAVRDFVALGQVARFPLALSVGPGTGAINLNDFANYAKANPGKANYGVPVIGGFPSTVGVALSRKIGVPMVAVPFPGSGPVALNVAGNQIAAGITGLADAMPLFQSGRLRIVAITGARRSSILPDVPTFDELGYQGLAMNSWYGFFAPKGLPKTVAERFNRSLLKALNEADVKQRIRDLSIEAAATSLDEAAEEVRAAAAYWAEAAKSPDFVRP